MPFIRTNRTGTGFNTGQSGTQTGGSGGGGGILLPGLTGWALTAGPEQTLSSEGVVASGPLDLSQVPNGNPIVYNTNGANFNIDDFQVLQLAAPATTLDILPGETWEGCCIIKRPTPSDDSKILGKLGPTLQWGLFESSFFDYRAFWTINQDMEDALGSVACGDNVATFVRFGVDTDNDEIFIQINTGSVVTASLVTPPAAANEPFTIGGTVPSPDNPEGEFTGAVRHLRLWKNQPVKSLATASWLANMSGGVALGRSDAEIAAYAG
jgi:hypothetical protein